MKKHHLFLKNTLTVLCFLFFIPRVNAQMKLEKRIEFDLKNGYSNEQIYKSLNGNFVMESRSDKKIDHEQEMKYDLYDSNLNAVQSTSLFIPTNMYETAQYNDDSNIYKLYSNNKHKFLLLHVSIDDLKATTKEGVLPKGINIIDMKVLGTKAWLQSQVKNKTFLLQIDLSSGNTQMSESVENTWNKRTNIVNYQLNPNSSELLMFVNKYIKKGSCELSQVRVNEACELCDSIRLTGTGDKLISSVSGSRVSDNKMVYTGTYSGKYNDLSEGIFFAEAENNKLNFINYVNFLDMNNFLSYMPVKSQKVILKKKDKAKKNGKEYILNYNIAAHDIINIPGGYLLIGEAYYPTTTMVPLIISKMSNGVMVEETQHNYVFDGYCYTHAFIARFSNKGELMWDQCFEMSPSVKPKTVKHFISVSDKTDKDLAIVFASGNNMVSKIIDYDGHTVSEIKKELIATGKDTEKTDWTSSNADYWYGNNFLVYGSQLVKDTVDKSRRRVFFVNKLSF